MHISLVIIRLWSDLQSVHHFELRHLLEGGAYFNLSIKRCDAYFRDLASIR